MTLLTRYLGAATLIGALSVAALATAQDGPIGGAGSFGPRGFEPVDFAAIDANGDGALARDELIARATGRIAVIDLDGDDGVSRAELVAALPARDGFRHIFAVDPAEAMADRILAMHGATASGAVGVAVLAEGRVNMLMAALDADRDDALSPEEAAEPMSRRADRDHRRGGPGGHGGLDGAPQL